MRTIVIGPSLADVKIEGNIISASFEDRVLVYELPYSLDVLNRNVEASKEAFWWACVIGSKPWHIAQALNDYFGVTGLFHIKPIVGKEEVQLR